MLIDEKNKELKQILRYIHIKNRDVLEIGCGSGRLSLPLAPFAKSYTGIDINENAINTARSKVTSELNEKLKFYVKPAENTDLRKNTFDTVFMILALHEIAIHYQGRALLEAYQLLKKNGQLLIADTPYPTSNVQKLYNIVNSKIKNFNHDYMVKHSQWIIKQVTNEKKFKLIKKIKYQTDWEFENFEELVNFMKSEFSEIDWNKQSEIILRKGLLKITKTTTGKIVIKDTMDLYDLRKRG